jgi:hypothetical protein
LLGQVGEQVTQPEASKPQPAGLAGAAEQDLGDGQADQLGVADPGRTPGAHAGAEQVVDEAVQCDDEGVEIGAHEASQQVDVALATPMLGTLVSLVTSQHPRPQTELII